MAAFEYKYRVNGINKVPASIAGKVCNDLKNSKKGLTPETLVEASRPENSPLHPEFQWDDSIAAEKYRCYQARKLIQNVVVVKVEEEVSEKTVNIFENYERTETSTDNRNFQREFVSTGERNHKYVTIDDALANEQWRASLLEAARRDMKAFISKYRMLNELSNLIVEMNNILSA